MLTQEQAVEIQVLKRQGRSIRQIAQEMGMSRNTVRRYLREASAVRYGPRAARPCKLDPHKAFLQEVRQAKPGEGGWCDEVIDISKPSIDTRR